MLGVSCFTQMYKWTKEILQVLLGNVFVGVYCFPEWSVILDIFHCSTGYVAKTSLRRRTNNLSAIFLNVECLGMSSVGWSKSHMYRRTDRS